MGRFFASQAVVCQLAYAESNLGNSSFPVAFLVRRGRIPISERRAWGPTYLSSWLVFGRQHCWALPTVGWGLVCVSPLVSRLVLQRARRCARRSFCFLGDPQFTSTQGSSVGTALSPRLLALRRSKPTLCHPLLFITYRGAVYGLRSTLSTLSPRAAVQLFLSCLQLPLRAPAALSCLFGSLLLLLPAVSATPFSPTPKAPGSTQFGGFLKQTTTRNREILSSFLQSPLLLLLPAVSATPFSPTPKAPGSTQFGGFLKQTTTRNREILSSFLQSPLLLQCLLLPVPFRYRNTNLVAPPPGSTPRIWYSTTTPAAPRSVISSTFGCSDACSILLRQRQIYTPWSHHE